MNGEISSNYEITELYVCRCQMSERMSSSVHILLSSSDSIILLVLVCFRKCGRLHEAESKQRDQPGEWDRRFRHRVCCPSRDSPRHTAIMKKVTNRSICGHWTSRMHTAPYLAHFLLGPCISKNERFRRMWYRRIIDFILDQVNNIRLWALSQVT